MEKIKKLWKEISVFGVVVVVFIALVVYHNIAYADYSTITKETVSDKIESKDSFVLVLGNSSETNTVTYQETMKTFVDKNRDESLYFVDLADDSEYATWIKETLNIDDATLPQTIKITDGEVTTHRSGVLSYYRLTQIYK